MNVVNEGASSSASTTPPMHRTEDRHPYAPPAQDVEEAVISAEELALVQALQAGDEAAFATLVERFNGVLLRLARMYVHERTVAEEVVQDTWIGVLNGIDRFEPRASLKAWIVRILMNRARTSAKHEGRSIPFSAAWNNISEGDDPAVDPDRFLVTDTPGERAGWWAAPPGDWGLSPEQALLAAETRACVAEAIAALSPQQREVMTLRDVEGWSSAEVRNVLNISEVHERVLLHRARSKVRQALERYFTREQ